MIFSQKKTTQAIQEQTRAIRESSNALNEILQTSAKNVIQENDKITNRNNQVLTNLVNSNTVDFSIVRTVSNLLIDKNKSQFSLEPVEGILIFFTINSSNRQQQIEMSL